MGKVNLHDWEWDKKKGVYVHKYSNIKDLETSLGTDSHGDVKDRRSYDPNFSRLYNSFEQAQQIRFLVALHWMKLHFSHLLNTLEKIKRKKLVIDLGCSRSFIYRRWKNNMNHFNWPQLHYWGVDSSFKRINEGRKEFVKKKNDSVVYFLADLSQKIIFPAKADVILCLEVIEHIPPEKLHTLLYSIRKNLKKNGIVIISSPNPKSEGGWVWPDSHLSHHYEYTWSEAEKIFKKNKFKILEVTGVLPDRNYYRRSSFKEVRDKLSQVLPPPMINNILLLIEDDMSLKRQWIVKLQKK